VIPSVIVIWSLDPEPCHNGAAGKLPKLRRAHPKSRPLLGKHRSEAIIPVRVISTRPRRRNGAADPVPGVPGGRQLARKPRGGE